MTHPNCIDACQNVEFEQNTAITIPANKQRQTRHAPWYVKRAVNGTYQLPAGEFSQQVIITHLLQHLRGIGARDLECNESSLKQVAIAIPAFSTNSYRRVVRNAAEASGIPSIYTTNPLPCSIHSFTSPRIHIYTPTQSEHSCSHRLQA